MNNFQHIEFIKELFTEIFELGKTSDKTFENFYKNRPLLTNRDKEFITSQVYSLIRNWRYFAEIEKLLLLNPTDLFYHVYEIQSILLGNEIPASKKFNKINPAKFQKIVKSLAEQPAILYSVPDWVYERCLGEIGPETASIFKALNDEAPQVIRTNTRKISRDALQALLAEKHLKTLTHPQAEEALILKKKSNLFSLPEFRMGYFEVQDISSQLTSRFVNPQPGWRVIDACAGNGGKSLHLANLMGHKGKILSLDIYPQKLETLKKRARRADAPIIETRHIDSSKVIKRLYDSADTVLLDVPCSGLGVLKRNPEIKWRLTPPDLDNVTKTQEDLLARYSRMVKPGGKLVYSTCSILPSENEWQIEKFIATSDGAFEFVKDKHLSPVTGFDGFYMAEMVRKK